MGSYKGYEKLTPARKLELIYDFDKVFGLRLEASEGKKQGTVPEEVMTLVQPAHGSKKSKRF